MNSTATRAKRSSVAPECDHLGVNDQSLVITEAVQVGEGAPTVHDEQAVRVPANTVHLVRHQPFVRLQVDVLSVEDVVDDAPAAAVRSGHHDAHDDLWSLRETRKEAQARQWVDLRGRIRLRRGPAVLVGSQEGLKVSLLLPLADREQVGRVL